MTPNELKNGQTFFVIDVETTGFNVRKCDVIEIAALKVAREDGKFVVKDSFDSYVNPQYPLPADIVAFNEKNNTGICDDLLIRSPVAKDAARAFKDFVGEEHPIVVGHNIVAFDHAFIDAFTMKGINEHFDPSDMVDTLLISKEHEKDQKKHNLGACFERTEKRHSASCPKFHTAIADCYATLDVLEHLDDKYYNKSKDFVQTTMGYTDYDIPEEKKASILADLEQASFPSDLVMIATNSITSVVCAFKEDSYIPRGCAEVYFSPAEAIESSKFLNDKVALKGLNGLLIEKGEKNITVTSYIPSKKLGMQSVTYTRCEPLRYKDEVLELSEAVNKAVKNALSFQFKGKSPEK